jgi:integrase/recombinase XerD
MKNQGNGQAKVLSQGELTKLFSEGLLSDRDRALFAICLFCGCRISEALALTVDDIAGDVVTLRKATTKGKLKTRTIDIGEGLARYLDAYDMPAGGYLFPGQYPKSHLHQSTAHTLLKEACDRVGLVGVSTHSFRRSALTQMNNGGVALRTIMDISGHANLGTLQRYLEVSPAQRKAAIAVVGF